MSNPDLLIAQLRHRNRFMFIGMLAGFAVIAIGLGCYCWTRRAKRQPQQMPKHRPHTQTIDKLTAHLHRPHPAHRPPPLA